MSRRELFVLVESTGAVGRRHLHLGDVLPVVNRAYDLLSGFVIRVRTAARSRDGRSSRRLDHLAQAVHVLPADHLVGVRRTATLSSLPAGRHVEDAITCFRPGPLRRLQ